MRFIVLVALALAEFCRLARADADVACVQVDGGESENFQYADFALWKPGAQFGRLLVVNLGTNQNGLSLANDPGWRALATSLGCGLVTCYFASADGHWDAVDRGSGSALIKGLDQLAAQVHSPLVARAPLLLVGSSQGGQFACHFAGWKPDRVLGFVSLKGGFHDASWAARAATVPGLFVFGQLDAPFRIENITTTFAAGRAAGAPWCLASQPQARHEPASCAPLLADFLQAVVQWPVAKPVVPGTPQKKENAVSVDAKPEPPDSWFPSPTFEKQWTLFQTTGLPALTPPPSFESVAAAPIATCDPPAIILPAVPSPGRSAVLSLEVTATSPKSWDGAVLLPRTYLRNVVATTRSPQSASFSFRFDATNLPIGQFHGEIPVRFTLHGNPVLGGVNAGLSARVVGDLSCSPSFIYLGPSTTAGKITALVKITSKSKTKIQFLSCEKPDGVELQIPSQPGNPLSAIFSFDSSQQKSASGLILLHLKTNREWVVRLPYFGLAGTEPATR